MANKQRKCYSMLSQRQVYRRLAQQYHKEIISSSDEESILNDMLEVSSNLERNESSADSTTEVKLRIIDELENKGNDALFSIGNIDESSDSNAEICNYIDIESNTVDKDNFNLADELASLVLECNMKHCHINKLLLLLRRVGHMDLPNDARTLLKTPRDTNVVPCKPGNYFHYGLERAIRDQLKSNGPIEESELLIDLNIDGLPLAKSSKSQVWPILGRICHKDFSKPFLIGAYHGYAKPASTDDYLTSLITEYRKLNSIGFCTQETEKKYTVSIRCVICDAPARSYISRTKSHNGYFGCSKCTNEGTYAHNRVLYISEDSPLRTDDSFKNREQEEHHTGTSPFESLSLGMVSHFILDYMHLVCLGVTKKLVLLWLQGHQDTRLSSRDVTKLSDALISLAKWIPMEFCRKPRTLEEVHRWKATEFRLFLLYLGPVVLPDFLPPQNIIHFNTLNCAIRILCDPVQSTQNNQYAKDLLVYFVKTFKILYGEQNMTYNVHNLIHLNEDVKKWGPLDTISAFPFENFMQSIKSLLRKSAQPLPQLHRRVSEIAMLQSLNKKNEDIHYPLLVKPINETVGTEYSRSHRFLKFCNFKLSNKTPDNCCYMIDGSIVLIENICYKDNVPVVLGKQFLHVTNLIGYPCESRLMNIYLMSIEVSALRMWPVESIKYKAVLLSYSNRNYVMPLLHQ